LGWRDGEQNESDFRKTIETVYKMPRNVTGGSGHKSQRNSEGSKARANRELVNDLLDDYKNGEKTDGVHVGRILRRMGNGRMEVMYFVNRPGDEHERERVDMIQQVVPMRGGLRGKGKGTVWVDTDSIVLIAETGLAQTTHEIMAVFLPEQVARYRRLRPDADERLFMKNAQAEDAKEDVVFEESEEEDVNIDDI
jgi:hypothetical protein